MPISRRRSDDTGAPSEQRVLARGAPKETGRFGGARMVGDFVMLDWITANGTVGLDIRSGQVTRRRGGSPTRFTASSGIICTRCTRHWCCPRRR